MKFLDEVRLALFKFLILDLEGPNFFVNSVTIKLVLFINFGQLYQSTTKF